MSAFFLQRFKDIADITECDGLAHNIGTRDVGHGLVQSAGWLSSVQKMVGLELRAATE